MNKYIHRRLYGLSDEEKAELMGTLQDTVDDLQKESVRLDSIKNKTISKGYSEG
jgi:hypothetical protein